MLSFIGWEAVSHLAGELRDPARQLPRAIFAALGVVVVLYLGLAVATVGVLGTAAPSRVPLADLMAAGLGAPGRTATAALAVLLTMGAMNAYVAAAVKLAGALASEGSAPKALAHPGRALATIAAAGAVLLVPLGADLLSVDGLVRACSASFVAVYVIATAAGIRLLDGAARAAAAVAFAAVLVVLAFSGPYPARPGGGRRRGARCCRAAPRIVQSDASLHGGKHFALSVLPSATPPQHPTSLENHVAPPRSHGENAHPALGAQPVRRNRRDRPARLRRRRGW